MVKSKKMLATAVSIAMIGQSIASSGIVFAAGSNGISISDTFKDTTFSSYVSSSFDTDKDGYLSSSEISAVNEIDISDKKPAITSVEGIEVFTELTSLDCSDQAIKALDVSNFQNLEYLDASSNQIVSLDLSSNPNLKHLDVSDNLMTILSLSQNSNLEYLDVSGININSIDLSDMDNLQYLDVSGTAIKELDLSNNRKLRILACMYAKALNTLDVSNLGDLTTLNCKGSALTKLDASENAKLTCIDCSSASISDINVSGDKLLSTLDCSNNKISSIDLSTNVALISLNINSNKLGSNSIDLSNNKNLTDLIIGENELSVIDLQYNTALEYLDCTGNKLTSIDLKANTNLISLIVDNNMLTFIDVSANNKLKEFSANNNKLTSLDLSSCEGLIDGSVSCTGNSLEITLDETNYNYDLSQLVGFNKSKKDVAGDFIIPENDNRIAMLASDKQYAKTDGAVIDAYNLIPNLDTDKVTYRYYYGLGNKYAQFTLNISNPFKVTVEVSHSAESASVNDDIEMQKGTVATLKAIHTTTKAELQNVTWSSGDNKIATIDENTGELSCIDVGTTPIYVIFNGRAIGYVNLKCAQPVSNITLDNAEIELECGTYVEQEKKSKKLTATVFPENATHKEVVWSSSDVKVARVNASDGTITAVGPGTATITCKSKYGENYSEVTATCTVNVKQRVNTVALSTSKLSLFTDETVKLTPNVAPETAENKAVTWLSDDESIVTVDGEGNVHAVATGTAHITCTSVDSPEAKAVCTVTVQPNASDITLNYTSCELIMGSSNYDDRMITLDATITSDTTDVEYKKTWTSSNTGIAKVSNTGVVTAVAPGEAIITCSINSTKYATCRITVKQLVTSINVVKEPNVSTLNVGETMVVTANILPANATNKAVVWESSDPEVVTVSQTGNINAVGKGVATITCSAQDGSERYRSFSITVKQQVETLSIDQKEISLYVGKTQQIIATVSPENADNKSLTWTSSDTSVATVSSSGLVRGCGRGTATITCTTRDGSNISESCNVTVTQQINKIVLNNTSATVVVGKTLALTATIEPDNANVKAVVWKSDNEKVAKVSNTGVVTAVSKGTANITCSATDGVGAKAICRITVQQPVKSIKLDATSKTLFVGKTGKLTATVAPLDASNRNLTWTSSNTNIVTVSNGTITAKAKGTATVTCAANDGSGVKATCKVTVTTPVTSIKLNATKKTLNAGKTMTLKATVAPTNAGNKNVTWTSSNTKVAKVSSTGVVKAVGRGTATITCTAKDGSGVKTTCVVTVVQKVTKITLNKTKLSLKRGNKYTLKATVKPTNADNRAVQWKTSNKNIATVSSNGVVTAKKKGTVTITCTAKDGSKKYAKCKITIK